MARLRSRAGSSSSRAWPSPRWPWWRYGAAACCRSAREDRRSSQQQTVDRRRPTRRRAASGGALTPTQIYQKYSPGVVEVVSTFCRPSGSRAFFGPSSRLSAGARLGLRRLERRLHPDQRPRGLATTARRRGPSTVVFKGKGSQTTTRHRARSWASTTPATWRCSRSTRPRRRRSTRSRSATRARSQVGEPVVAIGNPLGYDFSLTSGIVSATDRNLQSPNGSTIPNGIQTDAAINEGNSGGPLIDVERPRDRHQRADRLAVGRQPGSRLRRADRHGGQP